MKKTISLLLVAALSFGLLAGCHAEEGLPLSDKKDLEIRRAYVAYMDMTYSATNDLAVRAVWYEDGMYAVYVDSGETTGDVRTVLVWVGAKKFEFIFPDDQKLYIYKDKSFYTLNEAYAAGILQENHLESLQVDNAYANIPVPPNMDLLSPEARKDLEIRQAYADRIGFWYNPNKLSLRIVWQRDDVYALYIDSPGGGHMDAIEIITIEGLKFFFPNSQPLYIYVDGEFYALREAYENGVLSKEDLKSLQKDYAYINLPPESDFWDPTFDKDSIFPELVPSTG